ncbi:uncharacterized [Tachysurus ichikawai]
MQCISITQTHSHSIYGRPDSNSGSIAVPKSPTAALILSVHPSCRQSHQNPLAFSYFAQAESEHKGMMLQPRNAEEEMRKRTLKTRDKTTLHLFNN